MCICEEMRFTGDDKIASKFDQLGIRRGSPMERLTWATDRLSLLMSNRWAAYELLN
jgi:hypothetical protein